MDVLLLPTYFPSISHFVAIAQNRVIWEVDDHFQKQTNRNRMYIYSPNGKQLLNIPIKHSGQRHQKTRDVRIENSFDWQKQHFKSLEAAYRSSPFFEYFEDSFAAVFTQKHEFLHELSFLTIDIACKCLGIDTPTETASEYMHVPEQQDMRHLADGKRDTNKFEVYPQVFSEKFGYLNNLSILDLLCNEGKYAREYLTRQELLNP
jgi:hypothetical protein